jgi:hypothetical protein
MANFAKSMPSEMPLEEGVAIPTRQPKGMEMSYVPEIGKAYPN